MVGLLQTHTLTFYRHGEGYYDGLTWVEDGTPTEIANVRGSLQPYKQGKTTLIAPEGARTQDLRLFYSTTLLKVTDEFADTLSDYTIINNRQFQVFDFEDWTGYGLSTDHYKYLLVATDQNTKGGE